MIVLLYYAVAAASAVLCFLWLATFFHHSIDETAALSLFFIFNALNLPWVALRYFSIAIDEYIFFEKLEALRRGLNTAALLALLFGLPLAAFLLFINLGWAATMTVAAAKLKRRRVLTGSVGHSVIAFRVFFRGNRRQLASSAVYMLSETFIYNFPYFVVPWLFGLGAPVIIMDTTFKVFRAANQFYSAACDSLVPRQTSALAERDGRSMVRATWLAAILCAIPAAGVSGVLLVASAKVFSILLGPAAVMPPAATPIIIMLLFGNLAQMVSHSVLVHTGFFRDVARISFGLVAVMSVMAGIAVWTHFDIVQFLNAYAAIYTCGAIATVGLMIRGPIRLAHQISGAAVASR